MRVNRESTGGFMKHNIEIGEWLRIKREDSGFTQTYVAEKMGVSRSAVYLWEAGKRKMYADTLFEFCDVVGANPQDLVDYVYKKH
jgi:transcriptional regulator with XRE-family HTH domain